MYDINLDESMSGNAFEYLIADNYDPAKEIPAGINMELYSDASKFENGA